MRQLPLTTEKEAKKKLAALEKEAEAKPKKLSALLSKEKNSRGAACAPECAGDMTLWTIV